MSGRIMVVDDDRSMCELIEADLKRRGFHVSWYTSADEAFRVLGYTLFFQPCLNLQEIVRHGTERPDFLFQTSSHYTGCYSFLVNVKAASSFDYDIHGTSSSLFGIVPSRI